MIPYLELVALVLLASKVSNAYLGFPDTLLYCAPQRLDTRVV